MFTLTQCTPTRYDCTAGYRVDLDKEYTLQEFIVAILTNKKKTSGARSKSKPQKETVFAIIVSALIIGMEILQVNQIFRNRFLTIR